MAQELKKITSDKTIYHNTYAAYVKNFYQCPSVYDVGEDHFKEAVIDQLSTATKPLKVLGVGSGAGELDCINLKRFLAKGFREINNTIVEPSSSSIDAYKLLISTEEELSASVTTEWHQKTLQQYRTENESQQCPKKFHFISAIHSMYYMEDMGDYTKYLIGLLEEGGILFIAIQQDDNSGFWNISQHFPGFLTSLRESCRPKYILSVLDHSSVKVNTINMKHQCDITSCFDEMSTEGSLMLDFFTEIIDCRKFLSSEYLRSLLEYLKTSDCSDTEDGKILFRELWLAIIIKKK